MAEGEEDGTERVRRSSGRKAAREATDRRTGGRSGGTKAEAGRVSTAQAMRYAVQQLGELLGRAPESVSAVKPADGGWEADVEILELERVPGTTSVMASYRVRLDEEGELLSYERTRRYTRGQIDRSS
jgi:hypothetical protein